MSLKIKILKDLTVILRRILLEVVTLSHPLRYAQRMMPSASRIIFKTEEKKNKTRGEKNKS